jgi:hypothetical protein
MTDQALACLNMMDFTKKEEVMQKIQMNGTLQQLLLQYQQMALEFAQQIDPALAEQVAQSILSQGGQQVSQSMGMASVPHTNEEEHPYVERARYDARTSTQAD